MFFYCSLLEADIEKSPSESPFGYISTDVILIFLFKITNVLFLGHTFGSQFMDIVEMMFTTSSNPKAAQCLFFYIATLSILDRFFL
jgi:hypothetical protein